MLRASNSSRVRRMKADVKRRRTRNERNSYEKMMKTLLLQNQQIIIQQQNMMFMVIKQFQSPNNLDAQQQQSQSMSGTQQSINNNSNNDNHISQQQQLQTNPASRQHNGCQLQQQQQQQSTSHQQQQQSQQRSQSQLQTIHSSVNHQDDNQQHQQHSVSHSQSQQIFSQNLAMTPISTPNNIQANITTTTTAHNINIHHQMQQVSGSQLPENIGSYLTPAQSEQDPVSDKTEDDDLVALLENDALLSNNILYNPQTDIGSVTPYKNHAQQQQTPSYYSSGCESLTTPRVEQQRHQSTNSTTNNISQNVVKNLADSFKSPTKPKINVQILSGSATRNMKNSKAKIIQSMNISEFLRHVHPSEDQKSGH